MGDGMEEILLLKGMDTHVIHVYTKEHEGKPCYAKPRSRLKSVKNEKSSRGSGHFLSVGLRPGRGTCLVVAAQWRYATSFGRGASPLKRKENKKRSDKV